MARSISVTSLPGPEVRPRVIELLDLAFLDFQLAEIDRAAVDAWRRAGLESSDRQAGVLELFRQVSSC